MKATIFAKKKKSKEGREFYSYFTKLTKQDGTEETISVKFQEDIKPKGENCPLNIIFDKADANISTKTLIKEDGQVFEDKNLWIKKFEEDPEKFRDKSLDDYI